jgi:hypothetical protein
MTAKPYTDIESLSPQFVEAVVKASGRPPDNFVDSAEGSFVGMPAEGDHRRVELDARLDEKLDELASVARPSRDTGKP